MQHGLLIEKAGTSATLLSCRASQVPSVSCPLQRLQRTHPAMVEAIALNAMEEIAAGSSSSGTAGRSRPGKTACGRLVAAARLIIDRTSRCNRLERYGCFAELAWEVKVRESGGREDL